LLPPAAKPLLRSRTVTPSDGTRSTTGVDKTTRSSESDLAPERRRLTPPWTPKNLADATGVAARTLRRAPRSTKPGAPGSSSGT
jgi:hypothetical protein